MPWWLRICRIGPFARIRPDTVLHRDVHIGNFVEVKNSEIGAGSKANHLTYLGDTGVGSGVNVGAGSIVCNYDGANKWPTVIEDGAFIGSGSMLVAPVRIGAGGDHRRGFDHYPECAGRRTHADPGETDHDLRMEASGQTRGGAEGRRG